MIVSNIQALCKRKNISVPQLERHLGFGSGTIYRWRASSPTVDKLIKVADFFNVTVNYLIRGAK